MQGAGTSNGGKYIVDYDGNMGNGWINWELCTTLTTRENPLQTIKHTKSLKIDDSPTES